MKKTELQRHKKSDKIKWTLTAITLILFAVLLAGVCLQVFGKGKAQPSEWFKKSDTPQAEQDMPETKASTISSALLAANNEPFERFNNTFSGSGISFWRECMSSFQSWYSSVANISNFEYTVCLSPTCERRYPSCDTTEQRIFSFYIGSSNTAVGGFGIFPVLFVDNSDGAETLLGHSVGTCNGYSFEHLSVDDGSPRFNFPLYDTPHSHSNTPYYYPSIYFTITANSFVLEIENGSTRELLYTCNNNSDIYVSFLTLLQSNGYYSFFDTFSTLPSNAVRFGDVKFTLSESMFIDTRTPVSLPEDPVKEGHTFAGWYYGTQSEHGENCRAYDGAPIYEDTALHAHFNINRYTVTYDVAGGTPVNSMVLDWNTVAEKPTVSRTGYNFVGWFLSDGTQYINQPITADTTLTARWEIKTFTVTFYVGDEKHAELTVEYGSTLKELTEEAQAMNLQVTSIKASNGAPINIGANGLTEDVDVQAELITGADKVKNTVKNNWLTIALSAGGVVALIVLISALCSRKSKKAYRY